MTKPLVLQPRPLSQRCSCSTELLLHVSAVPEHEPTQRFAQTPRSSLSRGALGTNSSGLLLRMQQAHRQHTTHCMRRTEQPVKVR